MSEVVLQTRDLKGYYRGTFGVVYGVDGVSVQVMKGERMGLAGESGCGKTTFAELLTGTPVPLLYYEGGVVEVEGYDVWHTPAEKLRKEVKCKLMSYVPQAALNSLNPTLRIKEFVADMLKERTDQKYSPDQAREMLSDHFNTLNLDEHVLDIYPHELSGGMKQRVIIAISTYAKPSLLIVDEPTSSLDVTSQKAMIKMLLDIHRKEMIKSMIVVSHDLGMLRQLCDRIGIMYAGRFMEEGKMDDIISDPLHPYTKLLLGSLLPLERWTKHANLKSIPGRHPDLRNPPLGCRFHPRCPECMDICKSKRPSAVEENGRYVSCWLYSNGDSGSE
jgi:peptide/nickel transport system ATP-binding protein